MTDQSTKAKPGDTPATTDAPLPGDQCASTAAVAAEESVASETIPKPDAGPTSTATGNSAVSTASSVVSSTSDAVSTTKTSAAAAVAGVPPPAKSTPPSTTKYAHPIPSKGAPHLPHVPMHHPYAHHHYYAYHQHIAAANASAADPKKSGGTKKPTNPNSVPVPPYNPAKYMKPGAGGESAAARGKQAGPPPMYPPPPPHHHAYHAWAAYRYAQQHAQYHGGPPPPPPPGPPPPWNAESYAAAHQAYAAAASQAAVGGAKGNKNKGSPGEKGAAATGATSAPLIPPPQPHPPIFPPPPSHAGPYRFSDCTLRREALARSVAENVAKKKNKYPTPGTSSNNSSPSSSIPPHSTIPSSPPTPVSSLPKNGPVGGAMMVVANQNSPDAATLHMLELEARAEGATSPSQIEDFHKEEVATMGCTCKKTKCLKLYCQCFAVKIYCGANCRCMSCNNNPEHESERQDAIGTILARNPAAFDTKFQKNNRKFGTGMVGPGALMAVGGARGPQSGILSTMDIPHQRTISHKVGCKCRKSACMKKYCECYASNVKCSATCRCVGCKNQPLGGFGPPPSTNNAATTQAPSAKTTPTKNVITTPVKKEPAWMMNAAHNLAFLKHGSAEKPKRIISRAPSESGSMPSNESSSEESPVAGSSKIRTVQNSNRGMPIPSTAERAAVNALQSSEKTAVNALLMAAMAMTEMSGQDQTGNHTSGTSSAATTPPLNNLANNNNRHYSPEGTVRGADDHFETPQRNLLKKFMSPKRKVSDRNAETIPSTKNTNSDDHVESRNLEYSDAYQNGDEDSPKREHPGDGTPSLLQKVKRSRLGSLKKGARLLERVKSNGDQHVTETTTTETNSEVLPMEMATPAKEKGAKIAALTPVSARCIDFKNMRVNDSSSDRAVVDSIN
ncbi:unnamed protein product [Pseudo-nitzschia multistriata]|uniref:CRC domain-containing protein n=1 Tax=Pseudo-nitzschia multistriata TaxID=183589 RepID=A0A448ZIM0_9STRA|nr:unnamed protein product [Pseudo-nitzschia multistriata]